MGAVHLTRVDASGAVRERERTSSEPLGPDGARVLTRLRLEPGEVVWIVGDGGVTGWASVTSVVAEGEMMRAELRFLGGDPAPAPESVPRSERRGDERLVIKLGIDVTRLGPAGESLETERSVTENISPRGARVRTALTGIGVGDRVMLRERRGSFRTWATVRGAYVGADGVRRLSLEFEEPLALG